MAIFHLSAKVISRTSGRSAVGAAAYRSGERLLNERDGRAHDFRARSGVETTFIAAPEVAPSWALDRQALWSRVELHETRSNSTTAREWEAALPAELTKDQREVLARQFAAAMVERFGIVADCAIHAPSREGDDRNHHLHMLTTTREVTAEGFGAKTRELDGGRGRGGAVDEVRGLWADLCNRALEAAQVNERVDHRSHAAIRAEAQEAAEAFESVQRSLNPIGKRDRVQRAAETATEARERVQGLPEAPGTHIGPQRTAIERREARERAERERQEREAARGREREDLLRAAERQPLSVGLVTERVLAEAQKALARLQEVGVRAFVRENLSMATEAAGRFMERLTELGLVRPDRWVQGNERSVADTYGAQASAAIGNASFGQAQVAWAATAAEVEGREIDQTRHWADSLDDEAKEWVQGLEAMLTPEEIRALQAGSAHEALSRFSYSAEERLEVAESYLLDQIDAGLDRQNALNVVAIDRQLLELREAQERDENLQRSEREAERERDRDLGMEL